jgi:hypothetical protein
VDVVPIAHEGEDQQQKRDQQQAASFRRIDGVAMMLVRGVTVGFWGRHANIVALPALTLVRNATIPAVSKVT